MDVSTVECQGHLSWCQPITGATKGLFTVPGKYADQVLGKESCLPAA